MDDGDFKYSNAPVFLQHFQTLLEEIRVMQSTGKLSYVPEIHFSA